MKELLVDTFKVRFNLCEDKNGKTVGKGVFARAGIPTANRRVYPESIWRKNINKLNKDITERKVMMELDHPEDGKTKLQRVAAVITNLRLEGNGEIIGEMEVIPGTPNGDILSALIDANCTIGVSSRGYGSVKMNESGHDVVQDDYVLMTFDAVSDPANATSWPEFSKEGEAEESTNIDDKKIMIEIENKKEANMTEKKEDNRPESPKNAAEELPVVPSPEPYTAPETAKKYYGIFLKNDKEEYDNTVAKFIFTNKEDADAMAKQLTTDSDSNEKNVFVAKEIDYATAIKSESKEDIEEARPPNGFDWVEKGWAYRTAGTPDPKTIIRKNIKTGEGQVASFKLGTHYELGEPFYKAWKKNENEFKWSAYPATQEESIDDLKPWKSDIDSIIADVEHYMKPEDKDFAKMKRIHSALKGVKGILGENKELEEDNEKLTIAAKEMGFRYFLEKNLSHHPKYKEIVEGLGKLTKYETVEELRNLVKVHIEDANEFVKTKQIQIEHRLQRIENEFTIKTEEFRQAIKSKEAIVESKEKEIKSLRNDLSKLQAELTEEKSKVYLERKIQGLPNAFQIREACEKTKIIDNGIVDRMVESMTQPKEVVTESSLFNQVRNSLSGKRQLPVNNLVENAVKGTTLKDVKQLTENNKSPLINQSIEEFQKLAGLSQ